MQSVYILINTHCTRSSALGDKNNIESYIQHHRGGISANTLEIEFTSNNNTAHNRKLAMAFLCLRSSFTFRRTDTTTSSEFHGIVPPLIVLVILFNNIFI